MHGGAGSRAKSIMSNSREVQKEDRLIFDVTNAVLICFFCCYFGAIFLSLCQGTTLGDRCIAVDPSVLTSFLGGRDFEDLAWPTVLKKYVMSVSLITNRINVVFSRQVYNFPTTI